MKKTLFKLMGLALTIALLASLIIAVMPAGATVVSQPTVAVSPSTISNTGSYVIGFTTGVFSAFVAPGAATVGGATLGVAAGDTVTIVTGTPTFTLPSGDPGYSKDGVVTAIAPAGNTGALAVGDAVSFTTPQMITIVGAFTYYKNNSTGGSSITVTFPVGTTVPASIAPANVLINLANSTLTPAVNVTAPAAAVTTVPAAGIVVISVPAGMTYAGNVTVTFATGAGVINPGTAGNYTLSVYTSVDTTPVTSIAYSISAPGNIAVYNQAGAYLGTYSTMTGAGSLAAANIVTNYTTIKVGPGVYAGAPAAFGGTFTISANYVTLTSTGPGVVLAIPITISGNYDVVSNIIHAGGYGTNVAYGYGITVTGTYDTIQGCMIAKTNLPATINPIPSENETLLTVSPAAVPFTLTNSTVDTAAVSGYTDVGISLGASGATISNVKFNEDQSASLIGDVGIQTSAYVAGGPAISGCTFTGVNGGQGYIDGFASGTPGATTMVGIMNSTFTGLQTAIQTNGGFANISGNTISGSITNGTTYTGAINVTGGVGNVTISGNTIKNNTGYSVYVSGGGACTFVTGNNFSSNTKGFNNTSGATVSAVLNYWGAASGPLDPVANPAGTGDMVSANVTYQPFLTANSTVAAAYNTVGGTTFSTPSPSVAAGYSVSNYTNAAAQLVVGQTLSANPVSMAPPFPAIAYYDIFTSAPSTTPIQINLYASGLTSSSNAYFWSPGTNSWTLCSSQGLAGVGTYVYVSVNVAGALSNPTTPTTSDLTATYFVIVNGLPPTQPSFAINAPTVGATTALTAIPFTWSSVSGATKYEIILSVNGDLSKPDVDKFTTGTAYVTTATLTANVPYFWQVNAWQNNTIIASSVVGTFTPMVATTTATTPQITITTQPAPTITFTNPPSTVITIPPSPAPATITPAWIWGIIGIGAILIIVVIVLIVRTRRSA